MSGSRMNALWNLGVGIALIFGGVVQHVPSAHAAERIVGQVTKNEAALKKIEVDGVTYDVSPGVAPRREGRLALPVNLSDIRPGQGVKIELEKGVVLGITLFEGAVPK